MDRVAGGDCRWAPERARFRPDGCDTSEGITMATLRLGDEAPDFSAPSTAGTIDFHDWKRDAWAVLFSHPKDFTPVCTTELGTMARMKPEFDRRGVKIIGLSVDPAESHSEWAKDIADIAQRHITRISALLDGGIETEALLIPDADIERARDHHEEHDREQPELDRGDAAFLAAEAGEQAGHL